MLLKTSYIKSVSSDILVAVDTTDVLNTSDTLFMYEKDGKLYTTVSNGEYVVTVKIADNAETDFRVAVNAKMFLKLISQTTTEDIDLSVSGNTLVIKGNGVYRLPIVTGTDGNFEVPDICADTINTEISIDGDVLCNIIRYNSRQISDPSKIRSPLQSLYYIDENGSITYTTGATVYNFLLDKPISLLLTGKIVKMFKIFKGISAVVRVGHQTVDDQTLKVLFVESVDGSVILKSIVSSSDALVKSFPVPAIRGRATYAYPYAVNLNRVDLLQSVNRMQIFTSGTGGLSSHQPIAKFTFKEDGVEISDEFNDDDASKNRDFVKYMNAPNNSLNESFILNLKDVEDVLSTSSEPWVTVEFGNSPAVVFKRGNVVDVVPTCSL